MQIDLKDNRLEYCGRIDWEGDAPVFIFPSTFLLFSFFGRRAVLTVENRRLYWDNYAGAIVDGVQKKYYLQPEGVTEIVLVEDEPGQEREHTVLFFKRQDACHEMKLCRLELSEADKMQRNPLENVRQDVRKESCLPKGYRGQDMRIEVYGDSISAGEVSEAEGHAGKCDPEHQGEYSNSWYSYAWITARKLGAKIHNISQGGIPLLSGSGYVGPDYPGMEDIWDKLRYRPELGGVKTWDFQSYTPDIVIVAVGQNDSWPRDFMREEPDGEMAVLWKRQYGRFVKELRGKYPEAVIPLMTTVMEHHRNWDIAIGDVCENLADEKVKHFCFRENGQKTPGHIRMSEAEEMAEELADYIRELVHYYEFRPSHQSSSKS